MNQQCPQCNQSNPSGSHFCGNCGTVLAATMVQQRTVVLPSSSGSGVASDVDAKSVAERVRNVLGDGPVATATGVTTRATRNQRELTTGIIDYSDSMGAMYSSGMTKLQAAQRALVTMICNKDRIDSHDEIGLVAFNSRAMKLLDLAPIASHKRQMIEAIQALEPNNGTDINEGLEMAAEMLEWKRKNVVRRIVLLTDGQGGDPERTARELKSQGVIIDVIGIGDCPENVNEELLKQIASVVEGQLRYRFIKDHQTLIAHYTQLANKTATGN